MTGLLRWLGLAQPEPWTSSNPHPPRAGVCRWVFGGNNWTHTTWWGPECAGNVGVGFAEWYPSRDHGPLSQGLARCPYCGRELVEAQTP